MTKMRTWGLSTGYMLILMAIAAGFAVGYVHETVFVENDATATHLALTHNMVLFQFGIASWVLIAILDVMVSIGMYVLYSDTNQKLAASVALLRLIYTAMLILAIAQLFMLLFNDDVESGLANFKAFTKIWSYGLIVFGGHLVLLSMICWKSTFTPKVVSILLLLAGLSYVAIEGANSFFVDAQFWSSSILPFLQVLMAVGELAFAIWLIVRFTRHPPDEEFA